MKLRRRLYLSLVWVLVGGAGSVALGQSPQYAIHAPRSVDGDEFVQTRFFSTNPFEKPTTSGDCDQQNHCQYIDQTYIILDCTNEKAKCQSDPLKADPLKANHLKDLQDYRSGFAHVEIIKDDQVLVGWIRRDALTPLDSSTHSALNRCVICEIETSLIRSKAYAQDILAGSTFSKREISTGHPVLEVMMESKKFTPKCNKFIRPDGENGEWGNLILSELKRHRVFVTSRTGVSHDCPNFEKFSSEKKYDFFVKVLSGLALEESDCQENLASSPEMNKNGSGLGLFQMDNKKSILKLRNRKYQKDFKNGEQACPINSKGTSMFNPRANIKCAVAILSYQLEESEGLISSGTYWNPLLPREKRVKPVENVPDKIFKVYPGCQDLEASGDKSHD